MRRSDGGELPVPDFYRAEHAAQWSWAPDAEELRDRALEWRRVHELAPAASDESRVELLLIDLQRDFCLPEGSLFVGGRSGRGAVEDSDRIARFVYRHLHRVTGITATLDTHVPFQIFSPEFWRAQGGEPVSPHREVTAEEIRAGEIVPDPELARWLAPAGDAEWLRRQAIDYCEALERAGKYRLYLWPAHCLLGGDGHALTGVIQEARLFHAWARSAPGRVETKGSAPLTENYSALSPEVLLAHDGSPLGVRNEGLIRHLAGASTVIVAGQAASHCVRSTLEDLVEAAGTVDPGLPERIFILEDCMSAVAVPYPERPGEFSFDFTPQAEAALERLEAAGCRRLRSTDPWPDPGTPGS